MELRARVERRLTHELIEPVFGHTDDGFFVGRLSVGGLVSAIDEGARGDAWAMVVCLLEPPVPRPVLRRPTTMARRSPTGVVVRPDPRDPRVAAVAAALDLHVALLRRRRPAAWRAIDAMARHRTRSDAAREIGVSVQAVSRQVRDHHEQAARQAVVLLTALIDPERTELRRRP